MQKVAIITEFLNNFGGIEKSIIELTKELSKRNIKYDIYCGLFEGNKTFSDFDRMNITYFQYKKLPAGIQSLYLRYKFSKLKLTGYDGYIFYGFHSIAAAKNNHPNIMWSQGPLSYLYMNDDAGIKKGPKKALADIFRYILRKIDQRNIKHVDELFSLGNFSNIKLYISSFLYS